MLRWLINRRLNAAERDLGAPVDYLRHIARVSLRAFFKFVKIMPLAQYRRKLPAPLYHAARLVATQHEDCGTCVQIEVNLAKKAGVSPALLQAVLEEDLTALPEEVADACRFAKAVVTATGEEGELRERIRQRHGEEALVELALAIAVCRVFPTTKRALGYATSCARVPVQV
jgi:alkylhydroperoxidase family enzyme